MPLREEKNEKIKKKKQTKNNLKNPKNKKILKTQKPQFKKEVSGATTQKRNGNSLINTRCLPQLRFWRTRTSKNKNDVPHHLLTQALMFFLYNISTCTLHSERYAQGPSQEPMLK